MTLTYKDILISLLPEGAIWQIAENLDFDLLLDAMGENEERIRQFLANLAHIRDPKKTPILSDLEKEYGIKTNLNISKSDRRNQLMGIKYAQRANGSKDFLQNQLNQAGFTDLLVYDNAPAIDPDDIIIGQAQIYCGDTLAQCGEVIAKCASFSGELIVNGDLYDTVIDYLVQCGETLAQCGETIALAGNYSGVSLNPITYILPDIFYFFSETFISTEEVEENGGTIAGSPDINYGAVLTNGKYIGYNWTYGTPNELSIIIDADIEFLSGVYQVFVENKSGAGSHFSFGIDNTASTTLKKLYFESTPSGYKYSNANVSPGRHQYAMTLDSSGNLIFYVDGAPYVPITGVSLGATRPVLTIGAQYDGTLTSNATIYDTKLCNTKLSAEQLILYKKDEILRWWNMVFFVGGEVTRDSVTNKITDIEFVNIPIQNRKILKQLILKYKPMHSWCALAVNWI